MYICIYMHMYICMYIHMCICMYLLDLHLHVQPQAHAPGMAKDRTKQARPSSAAQDLARRR